MKQTHRLGGLKADAFHDTSHPTMVVAQPLGEVCSLHILVGVEKAIDSVLKQSGSLVELYIWRSEAGSSPALGDKNVNETVQL
jgi:hypothetical protein